MTWEDSIADGRVENLEELDEMGFERFPSDFNPDVQIGEYVREYEDTSDDFESSDEWTLAGRVTRVNDFGEIFFFDIADETGSVQLQFDTDHTPEAVMDALPNVDIGDFVEATGEAIRSNTGELTLHSSSIRISKTLGSPPSRDGGAEMDTLSASERVRRRSLALQYDDELHSSVRRRFEMERVIRDFLEDEGYLEVRTPVLHNVYGGAAATPFETYCQDIDEDMYLRIAPEIALKKMVIGGFDRIFEMGPVFRNESVDTTHNPEFTMLELYEAYASYEEMMELTEELVSSVVREVTGSTSVEYDGVEVDFEPPWTRLSVLDAVEEYSGYAVSEISDDEVVRIAREEASDEMEGSTWTDAVMALYEEFVEDEIVQPTFIMDHPSGSSPLCKEHRDDERLQERFEAVVLGMELANSYSERNNPYRQSEAFEAQQENYDESDEAYHEIDEAYLEALTVGLPPTGGLGIGIDRLAMLITDSQSIKDVLPFPMVSSTDGSTE